MKTLAALLLAASALCPVTAMAEVLIDAERAPQALAQVAPLGTVEILGVGKVRVEAKSEGTALTLWARDAQGRTLGEAHTVLGLGESEIFVKSPSGLERIRIRWPRPSR
jgi:hypothetical protein